MHYAYRNGSSSAPSEHRQKRQFQPSITSFFPRDDSDFQSSDDGEFDDWGEEQRGPGPTTRSNTNLHHSHRSLQHPHYGTRRRTSASAPRDTVFPTVPGHVQADLLSVGMRIRKAVPEGYKQHKTSASATPLPTIQTALTTSNLASISTNVSSSTTTITREPVAAPLLHQRELLPFCGLHKIGGYAEQPTTNVHLYGGGEDGGAVNTFPLPAEAFNQPFSSQDSSATSFSTDSLLGNPMNPHKRSWRDDNDSAASLKLNPSSNFLFALPHLSTEDDVPVSPLSETPAQSINALRTFAQPKTRRQQPPRRLDDGSVLKEGDIEMDPENTETRLTGSGTDFDEADFLRPAAPWTAREVEMSGMT